MIYVYDCKKCGKQVKKEKDESQLCPVHGSHGDMNKVHEIKEDDNE